MTELREQARTALGELVGDDADFRGDQFEAIHALVEERRRALVVQRTGWGKSAVYFVATKLLRAQGAGPTLLVSPLLSLMRNQIDAGQTGGVRAGRITSDNTDEWDRIVEATRARRDRPPARLARAVREPPLPRRRAPADRVARRPARDRRGALHQRLGPRLPPRLPPHRRRPRSPARPACRCCAPPRPRTTASSKTSSISSATTSSCCAARSTARASPSTSCTCRRRPSGWRGSRRRSRSCPGTGHRLHAHRRGRAPRHRVAARPRHRRARVLRRREPPRRRSRSSACCSATS